MNILARLRLPRSMRPFVGALALMLACGTAFAQACGQEGGRPCTVFERIPSCDGGLVEANGKCLQPSPCGGQYQRACLVVERIPSCDRDLAEVNGRCLKPEHCGAPGERACTIAERVPACDSNTVQRNGRCELLVQPQKSAGVAGGGGRTGGTDVATTRPRATSPATTSGGCPGGGSPQAFTVREACSMQPASLWVTKGLWGCSYAEAERAIPPMPGCRYVR